MTTTWYGLKVDIVRTMVDQAGDVSVAAPPIVNEPRMDNNLERPLCAGGRSPVCESTFLFLDTGSSSRARFGLSCERRRLDPGVPCLLREPPFLRFELAYPMVAPVRESRSLAHLSATPVRLQANPSRDFAEPL